MVATLYQWNFDTGTKNTNHCDSVVVQICPHNGWYTQEQTQIGVDVNPKSVTGVDTSDRHVTGTGQVLDKLVRAHTSLDPHVYHPDYYPLTKQSLAPTIIGWTEHVSY